MSKLYELLAQTAERHNGTCLLMISPTGRFYLDFPPNSESRGILATDEKTLIAKLSDRLVNEPHPEAFQLNLSEKELPF